MTAPIATQRATCPETVLRAGDPVTWLFRDRFGLRPWKAAVLLTLVLNAPVLLFASISGALFSSGDRLGLLHNYNWWLLQFTSIPAGLLFFFWLPGGFLNVIHGLVENKVVVLGSTGDFSVATFIGELPKAYSHWAWALSSAVVVAIFTVVLVVPEHRVFNTWETAGPAVFWYMMFFWSFVFWLGLLGMLRAGLAILWFNRLFTKSTVKVEVKVLHPDGAGGLSPLGTFSVKIGYLIGILALGALTTTWEATGYFATPVISPALAILLLVYVTGAPIVFFAPMWAARSAMREARANLMIQVADQFQSDMSILQGLLKGDAGELRDALAKLKQLKAVHAMASQFPVWPFNTRSLIRFFSAVLWPLVLAAVPAVIRFKIG